MSKIPRNHPRYHSLITREKISNAMKKGIVHETGLIAHGRGEAFDYIYGEKTQNFAEKAEKAAAAALILAKNPVISINGNVLALAGKQCVKLSKKIPAKTEINLFHRTNQRMKIISIELKKLGLEKIYGFKADAKIPGLNHDRGLCDKEGIYSSDVILVPLEDGDRCKALKKMNKKVITIDLNPLSRTAKCANITIVDNITRALPNITYFVDELHKKDKKNLREIVESFDNNRNLKESINFMSKRLNSMS